MNHKVRRITHILLAALVALLSSCKFDHLHYETSLVALVRIDVDWSKTHITPNGISAYVYNAKGELHCHELSSNPDRLYLKLPTGNYTVVLHNDDISEIGGVWLRDMKQLKRATIYATEQRSDPPFAVEGDKCTYTNEPDDVASYTLRGVEVTQSDIAYHYHKPDIADYEQQVTHTYTATPRHIVHRARVIARIGNLESAAGAPTALLRGMSGGYHFDPECTSQERVMEEFKVNTRVIEANGDKVEPNADITHTIYVDYNTFGMHTTAQRYDLDMRFKLKDNSYKSYHLEVTDSIRTQTTETHNLHIIEVALESLPEVEGGDPDTDYDDGVFDPSVDDWIDVGVNLPM